VDNTWPFEIDYYLAPWLASTNSVPSFTWEPNFVTIPASPVLAQNGSYQSGPYWIEQDVNSVTNYGAAVNSTISVSLTNGLHNVYGLAVQTALVGVQNMNLGFPCCPVPVQLAPGAIVELDRLAGEPLDVLVNGVRIARGEVVVVNEKFGIRLTGVVSATERMEHAR